MNKKLNSVIVGAIAAAGVAMAAPASAEQYISAQLGISEIGTNNGYSFDNGAALIGTWGMTIPAVHKYFGVEAEVSKSIVKPEANYTPWFGPWWGYPVTADYDYYTAGAYAVFTIPVAEKLSVRARGGVVYNHWKITSNDFSCGFWYPTACAYSGSDINPSAGAGVVYNFNNNINFMAELTTFDPDAGNFHLSAGAQFKF